MTIYLDLETSLARDVILLRTKHFGTKGAIMIPLLIDYYPKSNPETVFTLFKDHSHQTIWYKPEVLCENITSIEIENQRDIFGGSKMLAHRLLEAEKVALIPICTRQVLIKKIDQSINVIHEIIRKNPDPTQIEFPRDMGSIHIYILCQDEIANLESISERIQQERLEISRPGNRLEENFARLMVNQIQITRDMNQTEEAVDRIGNDLGSMLERSNRRVQGNEPQD